jgi:hypothetical protein
VQSQGKTLAHSLGNGASGGHGPDVPYIMGHAQALVGAYQRSGRGSGVGKEGYFQQEGKRSRTSEYKNNCQVRRD